MKKSNRGVANKKILFIATAFFGYEEKMKSQIEHLGGIVTFYDERSINQAWEKALIKISPMIFFIKTKKYYLDIIEENKNMDFDYVFVYGATMLNSKIIDLLKRSFKTAIFILYLVDSVLSNKRYEKMFPLFNKIATFDRGDFDYYKKKYNQMCFLPLFYIDEYETTEGFEGQCEYDIAFIGTIHSDRLRILKQIENQANKLGLKVYTYCYLQSWFMYFYYWIVNREFRRTKFNDFKYKKINASEIRKILLKSKSVLDIQYPKNKGLTMRTIESFGMRKKILTTNEDIKNYDFFDKHNIVILDRESPNLTSDIWNTSYREVKNDIYYSYSLKAWIDSIFRNLEE